MTTRPHDFVTVDMRGLKAALVARARMQRVSVSVLVRDAMAHELGLSTAAADQPVTALAGGAPTAAQVKLSIRFTVEEAEQLAACARAAGLSRGAYLAGLMDGVPVLSAGASRADHLASLIASSAELSTLSRNIHHLAHLLREGAFRPAQEYRPMLETLGADVRSHLALAARALADLRPRRGSAVARSSAKP